MVNQVVAAVLFRIALPLVLLAATLFRFNALSFVYLLLLLVSPLLSGPSRSSPLQSRTKTYLISVVCLSTLFCVGHIIYQIVLLSTHSYEGEPPNDCGLEQRLLTLFGLHRLHGIRFVDCVRLIVTDFLVLIFSTFVYVVCDKLDQQLLRERSSASSPLLGSTKQTKYVGNSLLMILGELIVLLTMAAAGILHASMFSLVYFISFLCIATWLGCSKGLGVGYRTLRTLLVIFAAFHYIALYIYQFDYSQEFVDPQSLEARLLGFVALRVPACNSSSSEKLLDDVRDLRFYEKNWTLFINPLAVLLFYFSACSMTRYVSKPSTGAGRPKGRSQSLFPHIESKRSSQRSHSSAHLRRRKSERPDSNLLENEQRNYDSMSPTTHRNLAVDGASSTVWHSGEDTDQTNNSAAVCAKNVNRWKQFYEFMQHLTTFLFKGSYVITLIIMMAWSITYHSWLTFILLLWSCLLWMMPNSRMACLKASPALVVYAEVLLILQFIYSLDLTDDELPKSINDINLAQIGLVKHGYRSYQALGIKIIYTLVFWLTLRQYVDHKRDNAASESEDQIRMQGFHDVSGEGHARQGSTSTTLGGTNIHIRRLGQLFRELLVRHWIWVVAVMLMVISLGGDQVVLYRIVYMVLCLFFILMFQFSYRGWIKVMYGFLLTVIIYSMLVLILIYTYQFEYFADYWEKYLHISRELQKDIGLEVYDSDPGSLLLKLLTPTIFLIVTIIQLHYFHKDFIRLNLEAFRGERDGQEPPTESTSSSPTTTSPNGPSARAIIQIEEVTDDDSPEPPTPDTVISKDGFDTKKNKADNNVLSSVLKLEKLKLTLSELHRVVWRLLEIHMVKVMFFSVFCLCVFEVCAVHILYVGFVVIALPLRGVHQFMAHCCSVWTAILLISKMIYQLKFVDSIGWTTNCTSVYGFTNTTGVFPYPFNTTIDNRIWIGFMKTDNLTDYCKGYIALIVIFTLNAIVKIHQSVERNRKGEQDPPAGVVFPSVNRAMADSSFLGFIKYIINYCFYKFGVEITLVTMVACIGLRLDVFALLTAFWLCCMFPVRRNTLARIWPFYVIYLSIVIPVQYLMTVGLPAGFCIEYPWYSESRKLQEAVDWLFLPDYKRKPVPQKILLDLVQLILACSQLLVFNIETGPSADTYLAGSNTEIYDPKGEYIGEKPNPVPNFIGDTSYFNRAKTLIFFLFYWITLAVMYLAGTNRISLFALFYILGCFFFFWNGNEFYLKPIRTLLSWWNTLIAYNVTVILIKCILQVLGCVYLPLLAENACWLVQLLGIACLKKLGPNKITSSTTQGQLMGDCRVPTDEAGLLWDGICFAFLLVQKRLFTSYYFHHLIIEILAQQELSSRGAEVIHMLQVEKVKQQREEEREIMEKIRMKMDRIRANQRKNQRGEEYVEPETHYQAIRSGDYYLFDDTEQPEPLDLVRSSRDDSLDDMEVKTKGLNAVLSSMMKGSTALRARARTETGDDVGDSSGMSAIISIDRSLHSHTQSQASSSFPSTVISRPSTSTPSTQRDVAHIALTDTSKSPPSSPIPPTIPEEEEAGPKLSFQEQMIKWLEVAKALLTSMLVSGTAKLHSFSGGYREVANLLDKEKEKVKLRYTDGLAILTEEYRAHKDNVYKPSSQEGLAQMLLQIKKDLTDEAVCETAGGKREPYIAQFLSALIYAFYARTEIVCYMGIVFNQIKTATLLSLPLPFMVFLWGSLSVPRPSKTFWITIITYTEAIVVVKYLFQFDFFKWNTGAGPKNVFDPPKLLGIERKKDDSDYALYDLMLLFLVFLHRFVLKSLGLWKDTERTFMEEADGSGTSEDGKEAKDKESKETVHPVKALVAKQAVDHDKTGEVDSEEEIQSDTEECELGEDDRKVSSLMQGIQYYLQPFKQFFNNLLHPPYQVTTDVYAWMFFCDFINFFIMVFGYWAFGTGGGEEGVADYFTKNEVPVPFLIMLLAQFGLIVIDRALYLRKYILGKMVFQQVLVLIIHIWMFFVLPALSQKSFADGNNLPPKLWYFIKCVYLLLSAYQIRCGYPTRILGNFFTKKYNYLNYFLFKGYMFIPFLYELRSLMDWIWTDTSMVLANWLKMEDIFTTIFTLKCQRRAEEEYPTPRGAKRSSLVKYGMGGTLLFLIILIIWFPLLLFSLGNTVGQSLPPQECEIQLSIGAYEPLFTISAQRSNMKEISPASFEKLHNDFKDDSKAQNYLANYDRSDIVVALLNGASTAVWSISPPSQMALRTDLLANDTKLELKLKLTFYREKNDSDADAGGSKSAFQPTTTLETRKTLTGEHWETRQAMAEMLDENSTDNKANATLPPLLPKFVHVPRKGPATVAEFTTDTARSDLRNLTVSLKSNKTSPFRGEWWEARLPCTKDDSYSFLSNNEDCKYLTVVIFADKVFPQALSMVSSYGIVGLYTTFVLLVSRVLRGFTSNTSTRIMFDDMPNVDRVLQLCLDIYLVRESKELALEEDLFAKLVFLYRSPETLIKWTRMPTEQPPPPHPPQQQAPRDRREGGAIQRRPPAPAQQQ